MLHRQCHVCCHLTGHLEIPATSTWGEKEKSAQLCGGHCQAQLVWVAYTNLCLISKSWCMHSETGGCNSSVLKNQKAVKVLGSWFGPCCLFRNDTQTSFLCLNSGVKCSLFIPLAFHHACLTFCIQEWASHALRCLFLKTSQLSQAFLSSAVFHGIPTKNNSELSWILPWGVSLYYLSFSLLRALITIIQLLCTSRCKKPRRLISHMHKEITISTDWKCGLCLPRCRYQGGSHPQY